MPDLVVEDSLIVELKCVDRLAPVYLAQCLSYLQASGLTLALLLNFQRPKVECRRVVREFLNISVHPRSSASQES